MNAFTFWKLSDMGFQTALMRRCYLPVLLKTTFHSTLIGDNPFNFWKKAVKYGLESIDETACYVLAARDEEHHVFFIKTPHDEDAYVYDACDGQISFVFDAEVFIYVMKNASRANKLLFFRNAVLPSIVEANKFLTLVEHSDLSFKDRNRAWTWIQQMVKQQRI